MQKIIFWLLCASIVVTGLCLLVYGTAQQDLRQNANDPQIQVAEDASSALSAGAMPTDVIPQDTVDISHSLGVFVIVYSDNGIPIDSSVKLNGAIPMLPDGVFDYVRVHGEDKVTWQPQTDVRIATVITRYTGQDGLNGFVVVGRSLREVENRETHLGQMVVAAWAVFMIFLVACGIVAKYLV